MKGSIHSSGNFKLNGKRTRQLKCGCCVVENLKYSEEIEYYIKQIEEYCELG